MTTIASHLDTLARAIALERPAVKNGIRRALASRKPPELWLALALALAAATGPTQARTEAESASPSREAAAQPAAPAALSSAAADELDTIASVTQGDYRYDLTNFSCAREAQLQAEGATSKRARAYGQWLAQQPAGSKSMTVRVGSAFSGGGCYERISGGIRVYVPGRGQPRDVIAPIVPGDPLAADLQPALPAQPMSSGREAQAERAARAMARADASVTDTLVAGRYVYGLTARTCEAEGRDRAKNQVTARDAEIAQWTRNAPGVYVRIHKDGEYDGFGCAQSIPGGIRIASFWSRLPRVVYGAIAQVR